MEEINHDTNDNYYPLSIIKDSLQLSLPSSLLRSPKIAAWKDER